MIGVKHPTVSHTVASVIKGHCHPQACLQITFFCSIESASVKGAESPLTGGNNGELKTIHLVAIVMLRSFMLIVHVLEGAWAVRPWIEERRETCSLDAIVMLRSFMLMVAFLWATRVPDLSM